MSVNEILTLVVVLVLLIAFIIGKITIKKIDYPGGSVVMDDSVPTAPHPSASPYAPIQLTVILPDSRPNSSAGPSLYNSMPESDRRTAQFLADVEMTKKPGDEWNFSSKD